MMGIISEIRELPEKYMKYRDEFIAIFKAHDIHNLSQLKKTYKTNDQFKDDFNVIWKNIAKDEGGKVSLTTMGIIIGSALGGVGIAAMGGAIGVPLALILGVIGFLSGTIVDSLGNKKNIKIKLSQEMFEKLEADSNDLDMSISELVENFIKLAYSPNIK